MSQHSFYSMAGNSPDQIDENHSADSQNASHDSDGGDCQCPVDPEFEESGNGATRVRMNQESYVRLLVGARETDPCAWPPGMEDGAALVERACQIEEECITRWGNFDPEKLSTPLQDEYLKIHLTLDELQESEGAQSSTHSAPALHSATATPTASEITSGAAWPQFPTPIQSENFA